MTYFAYGTLLDENAMRGIAPSVKSLGILRLKDYRMGFGQCARPGATGCMLEPDPGATMYGVLYDLSQEDMDKLDGAAVSGTEMRVHVPVTLIDDDGNEVSSVTYTIPGNPPQISPSDDYVRPILNGPSDLALPEPYVQHMKQLIKDAEERA